jgi:hypothetical protein
VYLNRKNEPEFKKVNFKVQDKNLNSVLIAHLRHKIKYNQLCRSNLLIQQVIISAIGFSSLSYEPDLKKLKIRSMKLFRINLFKNSILKRKGVF